MKFDFLLKPPLLIGGSILSLGSIYRRLLGRYGIIVMILKRGL